MSNDDKVSVNTSNKLSAYKKIAVAGKGAFGTAFLYERKHDGLPVIIKEINMLNLTASERQLALNEVKVLSTLNHKNIITYHDSFEEDGILKIEMEYADGGNLQELLSQLETPMDESEILRYFYQIASAVHHMHNHHILHRDLKTENIFLTKVGNVKVGDFGISKMTSTEKGHGASTILGTPYYISPEICEGKLYNDKSDIWALGCILYEMTCLHKTFEATNLPALVQKITKGDFAPIPGNYSYEFRQLVQALLQKEPRIRPSANEILQNHIPQLMQQCERNGRVPMNSSSVPSTKRIRSVIYRIDFMDDTLNLHPIELTPRQCVRQVATSSTHTIVLTNDFRVFVWGDNSSGQLAIDASVTKVTKPQLVDALADKHVNRIGAGNGFSIFACNNGIVVSCGDGTKGCLGHGDWNSSSKPKIIEKLLSVNITSVACGPDHVVVVSDGKWIFSWGCGLHGRLGHEKEENSCVPVEIVLPHIQGSIRGVRCGYDGTVLLTTSGRSWACGNNAHNKLGLDSRSSLYSWTQTEVKQTLKPTKITRMSRPIVDVALGRHHSAFLLDNGSLVTCGLNSDGQLGRGDTKQDRCLSVVSLLEDTQINVLMCGDTYTLAGTVENSLYLWGNWQQRGDYDDHRTSYLKSIPKLTVTSVTGITNRVSPIDVHGSKMDSNSWSMAKDAPSWHKSENGGKSNQGKWTLQPQEVLALFASPSQIAHGDTVTLSGVFGNGHDDVFVMVNTSIPAPHMDECPFHQNIEKRPEIVPDWIQKELKDSKELWQEHQKNHLPLKIPQSFQ